MTDRPTRPELPPGLDIEERVDDLGMGRRIWFVYVTVGRARHLQRSFHSREEAVEWCWNFAPADPWIAFADAEMAYADDIESLFASFLGHVYYADLCTALSKEAGDHMDAEMALRHIRETLARMGRRLGEERFNEILAEEGIYKS